MRKNVSVCAANDSHIVIVGGDDANNERVALCEYLSASSTREGWRPMTPLLRERDYASVVEVPPRGRLLILGGFSNSGAEKSFELYTPEPTPNGDWSPRGQWNLIVKSFDCMHVPKLGVFCQGNVLIFGESQIALFLRSHCDTSS